MSAKTIRRSCLVLWAVLALATAACHKKTEEAAAPAPAPAPPPAAAPAPAPAGVTVASLTLGSAIGADKKVTQEKDTFDKNDTIYAAVGTTGAAPSAKLTARWSYEAKSGSKPVKEDSQDIAPTGDATTEFHVSKPDGWPKGDYKIEILLDGKSVAIKAFRVA
jgi:hypothetical protein